MSTALIRDGCHGFKVAALTQHDHHSLLQCGRSDPTWLSQPNIVSSGPKLVALTKHGLYGFRLSDLTKDGCHGFKVDALT